MKFKVTVAPRSSRNELTKLDDGSYKIKLKAPPVDGAANEALIKFLSGEFNVAQNRIKIVKGLRGKNKVLEIK